ncbi:hypothetical protein U1701_17465 [Sphingomonas sp. PB2P19]|uniref:hypothetical protein n=1 Tax=Sphingomonas rhamnosi TaxID=3096156 RepID=UPI002FCBD0D1
MEIKLQGLSPDVREALAKVAAQLSVQAREDPGSINRLAELFERGPREDELFGLLLDLVPAEVDVDVWLALLDGGMTVPPSAKLRDPDAGRKPSARGAHVSAVRRRDELQRQVEITEAKLAEMKDVLAEAEQSVKDADHHLRQVVAVRMINDFTHRTAGLFGMGPAWTLMRVVSGYVRVDSRRLDELDPGARGKVDDLVATGKPDSAEMLDLLDLYAGDVLLELRLRSAILSALRKHHEPIEKELADRTSSMKPLSPAAKRVRRKAEERNVSLRAGDGIMSDRHDVLRGLNDRAEHEDCGGAKSG